MVSQQIRAAEHGVLATLPHGAAAMVNLVRPTGRKPPWRPISHRVSLPAHPDSNGQGNRRKKKKRNEPKKPIWRYRKRGFPSRTNPNRTHPAHRFAPNEPTRRPCGCHLSWPLRHSGGRPGRRVLGSSGRIAGRARRRTRPKPILRGWSDGDPPAREARQDPNTIGNRRLSPSVQVFVRSCHPDRVAPRRLNQSPPVFVIAHVRRGNR